MKYSIIIPTHNRPHLIWKVVSAFSSLKDCEIIIVENNSTQANKEKYSEINFPKNVALIQKDGIKTHQARFLGFKKSIGEYIFFIDDDDLVNSDFISLLNNSDFKDDIYRFPYQRYNYKMSPAICGKITKNSWFKTIEISTFLMRREFVKKDYFDLNFSNMEDQWSAYCLRNEKQTFIDICSISYDFFKEPESMTRSKRKISDLDVLKYIDSMKEKNLFLLKILRIFEQNKKKYDKKEFEKIVNPLLKKIKTEKGLPLSYRLWLFRLKITSKRK